MESKLQQIAFAVKNNKGVFALLLGSGISRAAGIPTGWDIVLRLVQEIAKTNKADPLPELDECEEWYIRHYGKKPEYDELIASLANQPSERNALLRQYFEGNDIAPSDAHKAIAKLVKTGHIELILTTNFDRLLEYALEDEGITPDVVTYHNLTGMRPIQHSDITIIKLHGDYRDWKIKNTEQELAKYPQKLKTLLNRIFSEYGLIVCGWSAEWDTALKLELECVVQRDIRYTTFWSSYSTPRDEAKGLIKRRNAIEINNMSADDFFTQIQEMVDVLERTDRVDPLSVATAREHTKKLIREGETQEVEDFLRHLFHSTQERFSSDEFFQQIRDGDSGSQTHGIFEHYFSAAEIALNSMAILSWYGQDDSEHSSFFQGFVEQWATKLFGVETSNFIPALLALYSAGIAAVYREKWNFLYYILVKPRTYLDHSQQSSAVVELRYELREFTTNLSSYLRNLFFPVYSSLIYSEVQYNRTFEIFEVLLALVYIDIGYNGNRWMPTHDSLSRDESWKYISEFFRSGGYLGPKWRLLEAGFFDRRPTQLLKTLGEYQRHSRSILGGYPPYYELYKMSLQASSHLGADVITSSDIYGD